MHRRHLNPSIDQCTQFSYLGVPAPAEGRRRNVGLGLVPSQGKGGEHWRHLNPSINPCTQSSYLGVPAPAEGRRRNVGLGLVPSQGKGGVHWRHLGHPIFIPWCAGTSRGSKEKCRAGARPQPGEGWRAQATPEPFHRPVHPIFIPWCAGTCRGSCRAGACPQPGERWPTPPFHYFR